MPDTTKRYSIMISTRKRIPFLRTLLDSIYHTTLNKKEVEIRIIYDDDDEATESYVNGEFNNIYNLNPPCPTYFHKRARSENLVCDYHNYYAVNHAEGKYIIFINDDTVFEIMGWDELAWKRLEEYEKQYPDGIVYGITEDFEREPRRNIRNWMACFPLISKKHVEVLGYAFDPKYTRDGADWGLAGTYRELGRMLDLRDCIVIRHISVRSGRREKDELDIHARVTEKPCPKLEIVVFRNKIKLLKYIHPEMQLETEFKILEELEEKEQKRAF